MPQKNRHDRNAYPVCAKVKIIDVTDTLEPRTYVLS